MSEQSQFGANAITNAASNAYNSASNIAANTYSNVANSISNIKDSVVNSTSGYSSPTNLSDASQDFLQSNTIIAKIAFVFFVVIVFLILLRLGIFLLGYFSQPTNNPYLINGLINGSTPVQIKQDPKDSNSITVLRSNNQPTGIEFSWSVWLYINNVQPVVPPETGIKYQHIFHKGIQSFTANGIAAVNNAPGVYLSSSTDPTLHIIMDTVVNTDQTNQIININNIPLQKWFHLLVRMQNTSMDVYVNGVITSHIILQNVPKQNYQDVFACQNGGFSGNLSNLRYYDRALNVFDINSIVNAGPNLTISTLNASSNAATYGFSYLSSKWYTNRL
jgi:hypothetical protein